ncbi:MAG: PBECR4 domain-containing protein [Clostridia bacterium]|nr:PBECR4 domain-containing protein [Clostridia bacterium]
MGRETDKIKIAGEIKQAAKIYKQKLLGKRFMYVFDNRYIEVIYKAENFRHLTGVDTNLSAKRFYDYAVRGTLSASQIGFSAQHPYSLCIRKLKHIGSIATLAYSECFMLEEIKTNTMSYKFGTTDLNFTLCLNKDSSQGNSEKNECFIVHSLRDEDCFSKSKDVYTVTHIFSRQNDKKLYTDIIYADKASSIAGLPDCIKKMLDKELLNGI